VLEEARRILLRLAGGRSRRTLDSPHLVRQYLRTLLSAQERELFVMVGLDKDSLDLVEFGCWIISSSEMGATRSRRGASVGCSAGGAAGAGGPPPLSWSDGSQGRRRTLYHSSGQIRAT